MKIIDVSLRQDERLSYLVTTILPALEKYINEYITRKKINGEEIDNFEQTKQVYEDIRLAVSKFAEAFKIETEITITPEEIQAEYTELSSRIATLQSDPEIKYLEAVKEFQNIEARKSKLEYYISEINKQKESTTKVETLPIDPIKTTK